MYLLKLGSLEYTLSSWLFLLLNSTGQVVAYQYGQTRTDEQVNSMDCNTKINYLKRNPVIAATQIDYVFKQLWGKVVLSWNAFYWSNFEFWKRRDFQTRETEHIHISIHIVGAPKNDENKDSEVVEFKNKYITCALPDETEYPEMNNLVKKVQANHHTSSYRKKRV